MRLPLLQGRTGPRYGERPPWSGSGSSCWTPGAGYERQSSRALAHKGGDRVILDALRERRPSFSPEDVVEEFAGVLERYKITRVIGDRYDGEWPREGFRIQLITNRRRVK
jgi:hypothetical protein